MIGVVCGLRSEAAAVRAAIGDDARVRVGVSGANAARAETIAAQFCEDGARAILSVGVSGGLDPDLQPGDLVVGDRVINADGAAWPSDMGLLKSIITGAHGNAANCGSLFGSDNVIAGGDEKAALYQKYGCLAVDMESHGAARAASAAGVPFLAVRAIADPAERALPPAALNAVAPDGSTRVAATLIAALRDPKQFPMLIKLGRDSSAAVKTLRTELRPIFARLFDALDL